MARYTPEFLAALRHRYEQTHQSERSIARDFGVAASTVRSIASKHGWLRQPEPMRDLEPAMRLLEQATALEREVDRQRGVPDLSSEELPARIPVARYTPRLLAALRRRYEHTRQPVRSIARDFGVSDRTLRRIASTQRWLRLGPSWQDLEPAAQLLEEVTALERLYLGDGRKKWT
jgi:transposase-like protein